MTNTRPDEFVVELYLGGTWVDVTPDVELNMSPLVHTWAGKPDQFGPAAPSRVTFQLVNNGTAAGAAGKYSPDNPLSAYYGQLTEGTPARWSIGVLGGVATYRRRYWFGEVQSLVPIFPGDDAARGMVQVVLVDWLARAGRITLQDMVTEQTLTDGVAALWLLDEDQGALVGAESSPADVAPLLIGGEPRQIGWGGGNGLAFDGKRTALLNQNDDLGPGWLYLDEVPPAGNAVLECWISYNPDLRPGPLDPRPVLFEAGITGGTCTELAIVLTDTGKLRILTSPLDGTTESPVVADGRVHHVAVFGNRNGGGDGIGIYVDGALLAVHNRVAYGFTDLKVGRGDKPGWQVANSTTATAWRGSVSRVALAAANYLNQAQIPARYALGTGAEEGAPERVTRLMSYARGPAVGAIAENGATFNSSIGSYSGAPVGAQETQGKSLLAAMQEAWAGEGGRMWPTFLNYSSGAAVLPTGPRITFSGRGAYRPSDVSLTVHVESDLTGAPQLSRDSSGQVSVATASSRSVAVTVSDAALITRIGQVPGSVGNALARLNDQTAAAQDRIAQTRDVRLRLVGIVIDAFTAPASGGYSRLGGLISLTPGQRIRVTGLPTAKFGYPQMDCYLISCAESHSSGAQSFALGVVAADAPAEMEVGDDTYNRVSSPAASNLRVGTGGISAAGTTLPLQFTAGPGAGLTLSAGAYPLDLDLNGECVTVAGPPAGATSPQSVTVSRGQRGTVARAHVAAEPVDVWLSPRVAW